LIDVGDARFLAQDAGDVVLDRHAEPFELAKVEIKTLGVEHLAQDQVAVEYSKRQSIRLRCTVQVFCGYPCRRTGHVLDDKDRMAGNMFAHMPGHRPGVDIEAAAGRAADNDANSFAFVEVVGEKRLWHYCR
jgi:hypothetical protein